MTEAHFYRVSGKEENTCLVIFKKHWLLMDGEREAVTTRKMSDEKVTNCCEYSERTNSTHNQNARRWKNGIKRDAPAVPV